jgi:hypothetical protein
MLEYYLSCTSGPGLQILFLVLQLVILASGLKIIELLNQHQLGEYCTIYFISNIDRQTGPKLELA